MYKKRRRLPCLAAVLACALLLASCGSSSSAPPTGTDSSSFFFSPSGASASRVEGSGFATPEAAAQTYMEGLKAMDVPRMMSCFAVESYVDGFDFEAQLERLRAYMPTMDPRVPNTNDLFQTLNVERRRATISNSILGLCIVLSNPMFDLSAPMMLAEDEVAPFVAEFDQMLAAVDFDRLEVLGHIRPASISDVYASEANQSNIARQAAVYGADQIVSCIVAFELDGYQYFLCFDVAEYSGSWHLLQLGGNIANILALGIYTYGLGPLDPDLFEFDIQNLVVPF